MKQAMEVLLATLSVRKQMPGNGALMGLCHLVGTLARVELGYQWDPHNAPHSPLIKEALEKACADGLVESCGSARGTNLLPGNIAPSYSLTVKGVRMTAAYRACRDGYGSIVKAAEQVIEATRRTHLSSDGLKLASRALFHAHSNPHADLRAWLEADAGEERKGDTAKVLRLLELLFSPSRAERTATALYPSPLVA